MMPPYFVGANMQVCRVIAVAAIAAATMGVTGEARTLRADEGPAEYPPASFTANQYVDSRGCVYVRAGYAGQVSWVPRVSRDRKVLCGFTPSLAKAKPAAQPTPKTETVAATPKKVPTAKATAKTVVKTKRGATAPMDTVASIKTTPRIGAAKPSQKKPAAAAKRPAKPVTTVAAAAAAPKTRTTPKKAVPRTGRKGAPACQGASKLSNRYINDGRRFPVRCGPQEDTGWQRRAATETAAAAPRAGRTAPVAPRVAAPAPVAVPKGYQLAWKDDRLNPNRGVGTAQGEAQMNLIWTQEVPRRLIDTTTGHDVTRQYSHLRYPYTNYAQQRAHISTKSAPKAKATVKTRTVVSTKSAKPNTPKVTKRVVKQAKVAPKAKQVKKVKYGKQAKTKPRAVQAASHRYVQVGSFGVASNAEKTKARLRALGLPVAVANGRLQTVLAGPFTTQAQLNSALGAVRKAGYGDAFLRK